MGTMTEGLESPGGGKALNEAKRDLQVIIRALLLHKRKPVNSSEQKNDMVRSP